MLPYIKPWHTISLFLLRENSKNAFSIFVFILMAGVFIFGSYFTNYSKTITYQAKIFQGKLSTIVIFIPSFVGRLVNTPLVACHSCGWHVYTLLGVHGVTVGWSRTNDIANNEQVHSFCWFLPNPFIEDLFFWRTCSSQGFVKTDLYPLSRSLLISVWYAVCSTRRWSTCRPLLRAC